MIGPRHTRLLGRFCCRVSSRLRQVGLCLLVLVHGGPCEAVAPFYHDTDEISAMRQLVDQLLQRQWRQQGVEPVKPASDFELLRRLYLDLIGRIPRVSEVRDFLDDDPASRRETLVARLLTEPGHATHLTNSWKKLLLPDGTDLDRVGGVAGFDDWLRRQFAENVSYDQLATDLLLAEGEADQSGPTLFYTALEVQPEKIAASTSRALLGVQLQCAQCHDHPFDRWTQRDFWGYAAFFARVRPASRGRMLAGVMELTSGEVTIPDTDDVVKARFLGATDDIRDDQASRREQLARWLVGPANPFFSRAAVNRVWTHLFGRGIVHPPDDMGKHNPSSHPELLDALSSYFQRTDHDLRNLIGMLVGTKAYQLSSAVDDGVERSQRLFAQMSIKSLTPEQLYDSLAVAICRRQSDQFGGPTFGLNRFTDQSRQTFLNQFRSPSNDVTQFQAGMPQALSLMNGQLTADGTNLNQSDILVSLSAPIFSDPERIEVLFLATLSRPPSDSERTYFADYISGHESIDDRRQSYSDVLWALLNSAEFALNH